MLSSTNHLMSNEFDAPDRGEDDHEEIELMLEGFRTDIHEIMTELRSFNSQIVDTTEFINTYQVSLLFWTTNTRGQSH